MAVAARRHPQRRHDAINNTATESHTAEEGGRCKRPALARTSAHCSSKMAASSASFGIHSRLPRVWTPDEIALTQDVAERVWATLEHRKAEAELRANEERLEFLLRLNDALRPLSDAGEVQATAARLLAQHFGATRVGYAEFDGGESEFSANTPRGCAPRRTIAGHHPQRGNARGAPPRRDRRRQRRPDGSAVERQPPGDHAGAANRRSSGRRCSRTERWSRPSAPTTSGRASGRRRRLNSFTTSPNGPGTRSSAPAPKRRCASRTAARRRARSVGRRLMDVDRRDQPGRLGRPIPCAVRLFPDEPATADAWIPRVHDHDRPRVLALLDEIFVDHQGFLGEHVPDRAARRNGGLDPEPRTCRPRRRRQPHAAVRARSRLQPAASDGGGAAGAPRRGARSCAADPARDRHPGHRAGGRPGHDRHRESSIRSHVRLGTRRSDRPADRASDAVSVSRRARNALGTLHLVGVRRNGSTFPIEVT